MKKIINWLRFPLGIIAGLIIMLSAAIISIIIMLLYITHILIPWRKLRIGFRNNVIYELPGLWARICGLSLGLSTFGCWEKPDLSILSRRKHYLLIANHRSWFDILLIAILTQKHTPPFRFFMKRELLWQVPIAGVMCWMIGFPFMRRHTRTQIRKNPKLRNQDIETTKQVCRRFIDPPITFINFPEGTRFSEEKKAKQNSPYTHLLKPRSGGCALITNELTDYLGGVIDLTIYYSGDKPSIFKLLTGQIKHIACDFTLRPITEDMLGDYYNDREYRARFQNWLNKCWEEKDAALNNFFAAGE